jgi:uncharacterized integral membrane protein
MKFKIYLILFLVLLLIVFVLQNTQPVDFTFLFFSFKITQVLLLFLTFALGLIVGILLTDFLKKRKDESNSSENN